MPVVVDGVLIGVAGFAAARRLDLGAGRPGSAAAGGARRGAHGRAQARRRRAARRRGALPRHVRRLAAGHLPGGTQRRRPLPESGRRAHHRPHLRGDGGTRLDERPSPRGSRSASSPTGTRRSRRASDYTTPIHRFVHKNGEVRSVEVRAVPVAGQPHGVSLLGILEDVTERLRAREGAPGPAGAHRGGAGRGRGGAAGGGGGAGRRRRHPVAHLRRVHRAGSRGALHLRERPRAGAVRAHARPRSSGSVAWVVEPAARRRAAAAARSSRPSREQRAITVETPVLRPSATRCASTRRRRACRCSSRTSRTASGREEQLTSDREYLRRSSAAWTRRPRSSASATGSATSWSASAMVAAHEHHRPHHGRDRHRQGAGRARDPRGQPAARARCS